MNYQPIGYLSADHDPDEYPVVSHVTLDGETVDNVSELNDEEGWLVCFTGSPPEDPTKDWPKEKRLGKVQIHWADGTSGKEGLESWRASKIK